MQVQEFPYMVRLTKARTEPGDYLLVNISSRLSILNSKRILSYGPFDNPTAEMFLIHGPCSALSSYACSPQYNFSPNSGRSATHHPLISQTLIFLLSKPLKPSKHSSRTISPHNQILPPFPLPKNPFTPVQPLFICRTSNPFPIYRVFQLRLP